MLVSSTGFALEKGSAGARYHRVDEEAIAFRDIAEVIASSDAAARLQAK